MLQMPESDEPFRVASFDPGSSNLGQALLEHGFKNEGVAVKTAYTSVLRDTHPDYSMFGELHGSRVVRLMIMRDLILDFLRTHRPHAVIVESNYLGRFATSFAALVECVAVIRSALFEYDPFIPLYMVDPTTVKTNVGMKKIKGTDKEDVRRVLVSRPDVVWGDVDHNQLDEHSIDAVAIGYYFLTQLF